MYNDEQRDGVVLVSRATNDASREDQSFLHGSKETPNPDKDRFPASIPYIMSNEICERFSYYGLRAILALYLANQMGYSQTTATSIVHAFTMAAYFTPILGGLISDVFLGKYKTMLYISMIYCLGSATLSITAVKNITGYPPSPWGLVLGLTLVAFGTGGIKPLVSSFVGDQFTSDQSHLLERVFRLFYFCINLGSVFSTLITPILRTHVGYAAAFGLPACLLIISCLILWSGRPMYHMQPPQGSVLRDCTLILYHAIKTVIVHGRGNLAKDKSFLFLAEDLYPAHLIQDVRAALRVLLVFLPLPVFWALFDQHSTRWIFQAEDMNLQIGKLKIDADQVPSVNPLLVLILVPIFDMGIYPAISKIGKFRPLPRMAVGMVFASAAFVMAAIVQRMVDSAGKGQVSVFWQLPQYAIMTAGEVMVSITGLEFAYTQAPKSMKSLIMAGWLLSVSLGNFLVVAIAESVVIEQWKAFLLFAALMIVFDGIFLVILWFYKYADEVKAEKESN